jgi:hypothetical protein
MSVVVSNDSFNIIERIVYKSASRDWVYFADERVLRFKRNLLISIALPGRISQVEKEGIQSNCSVSTSLGRHPTINESMYRAIVRRRYFKTRLLYGGVLVNMYAGGSGRSSPIRDYKVTSCGGASDAPVGLTATIAIRRSRVFKDFRVFKDVEVRSSSGNAVLNLFDSAQSGHDIYVTEENLEKLRGDIRRSCGDDWFMFLNSRTLCFRKNLLFSFRLSEFLFSTRDIDYWVLEAFYGNEFICTGFGVFGNSNTNFPLYFRVDNADDEQIVQDSFDAEEDFGSEKHLIYEEATDGISSFESIGYFSCSLKNISEGK